MLKLVVEIIKLSQKDNVCIFYEEIISVVYQKMPLFTGAYDSVSRGY